MDDKRIEEMLRESWQPQPPDGMRERVLDRANEELERRVRTGWHWFRWETALAALGLLIVIVSGISDSARQSRLAALQDHSAPNVCARPASGPVTMAQWRSELYKLSENPNDGLR